MCFNQRCDISTLKGGPLKLVDKFTYLGNDISSTDNDINMRLAKAWTAIESLSVIWKSDLTDKIKRSIIQAAVVSILLYGRTTWTDGDKTWRQLHKNAASRIVQVFEATPHKTVPVYPPTTHHKNYPI